MVHVFPSLPSIQVLAFTVCVAIFMIFVVMSTSIIGDVFAQSSFDDDNNNSKNTDDRNNIKANSNNNADSKNPSVHCSVNVRAHVAPAPKYEGASRHNPDKSTYPGDALYYYFSYYGSDTCLSFNVNELKSYGAITIVDPNKAQAINVTGLKPDDPRPQPSASKHAHSSFDLWAELVNEKDVDDANGGVDDVGINNNHDRSKLAHYIKWSMQPTYHVPHDTLKYRDTESAKEFLEYIQNRCTSDRRYAGCAWGGVEVDMDAKTKVCLYAILERAGVSIPNGIAEECKDHKHYVTMSVEGDGKRCTKKSDDSGKSRWVCVRYTATSTATVQINVLDPIIELELTKPPLYDAFGFESQNLDGTYYLDDPVHVLHHPDFKWKDERAGTIIFKTYRHWCSVYDDNPSDGECSNIISDTPLPILKTIDCVNKRCQSVLSISDHTDTVWNLGNGDGQTVYVGSNQDWYGKHLLKYKIKVYNIEQNEKRMLNVTHVDTTAKIVVYHPVFESITYPVLSDDGHHGSDNRFALASRYFGSWGGGDNDYNKTEPYEYRRARIDMAFGFVSGFNLVDPHLVNGSDTITSSIMASNLIWTEAPLTPSHVLDYGATGYPKSSFHSTSEPVTVIMPLLSRDAAMWPKAGYGRIFFDFSSISEYELGGARAVYANATAYIYTFAQNFAGSNFQVMESEVYVYPDATFNYGIIIKSVDADGNLRPADLIFTSTVRKELPGAGTLVDYIHEKMLYDTNNDLGFADLAIHDTYVMDQDIETDSGYIETKIRRTASWFPKFTHDAHNGTDSAGGPDKIMPYELLSPLADVVGNLFGSTDAFIQDRQLPLDNHTLSFIDMLYFFVKTTDGINDPLSDGMNNNDQNDTSFVIPTPQRRADLEILMMYVNATKELGYSGPAELSTASYWAYPDTSRMNMPLSIGLSAPSPLNITYGNNHYQHIRSHTMPGFDGNTTVIINSDHNNIMNATRHGSTLLIHADRNFGPILFVELNDANFTAPLGILQGRCAVGCAINVGHGEINVTGYNQWGGTSHFYSQAQPIPEKVYVMNIIDYDEIFLVIGIVIFGLILHRLVKNRLELGIWTLRA